LGKVQFLYEATGKSITKDSMSSRTKIKIAKGGEKIMSCNNKRGSKFKVFYRKAKKGERIYEENV